MDTSITIAFLVRGGVIGALNARDYKDPLKVMVRKHERKEYP